LTDVIENVSMDEALGAIIKQTRPISENFGVKGYVTVIKNIGREDEQVLAYNNENLLTQGGRDAFHNAMYSNQGAITQDSFSHIALSVSATGKSSLATSLTGEITGTGLARTNDTGANESTTSHTATQNTTTVSHTFTATGIHTAVQLCGLLDNSAGGTLGHENTFTSANLEVDDTLTVTWTITAG